MSEDKRKVWKKIFLWVMIPALVIVGGTIGYTAYLANEAKKVVDSSQHALEGRKFENKSDMRDKIVDPSVDNISILFLGIDTERGVSSHTRTDAMILATFNEAKKSVKLVSIPRDSRIELVGRDTMDKAAHAHAYGGVDMAVKSVEKLFDIPVDYFVLLNFDAFVEIVDTLGGIEVDVPFNIVEQDSDRNQNAIRIEEGLQTLNGEQALAFARTRKYDSDIDRTRRQQQVLRAIIEKGLSINSITKYKDVLKDIGDNLSTNMSFDEMTAFHDYATWGAEVNIDMMDLTGRSQMINSLYYYILDDDSVSEISNTLKTHLEYEE